MKVTYETLEEFHSGIAAFVMKGLTFEATASDLTIELTGGY